MPRYFFDVLDMNGIKRDDLGVDYSSPHEARDMALIELPMIAQRHQPGDDRQKIIIQVRDESGAYIFRGRLSIAAKWLKSPPDLPANTEESK